MNPAILHNDRDLLATMHLNRPRIIGRLLTCLLSAAMLTALGCDDTGQTAGPPGGAKVTPGVEMGYIAFVGAGANDPVWPLLKTSAQRYAKAYGRLPVIFHEPRGNDVRDQIELLESLTDVELRGLCVQINDVDALTPILNRKYNDGIRIVSMIKPAPVRVRAGHVGFNELEIGAALAEATKSALSGEGMIMVLHAGFDDNTYHPRLIGFQNGFDVNSKIDVLAKLDCGGDAREARRIMRDRSIRYPRLSAWVTIDRWPLEDFTDIASIMPPGCKLITVGGVPADWPLIRSGVAPVMVGVNYHNLGSQAVQICESAIREPAEQKPINDVPLRQVSTTNLDEYQRDWTFWSTGKYPATPSQVPMTPSATPLQTDMSP